MGLVFDGGSMFQIRPLMIFALYLALASAFFFRGFDVFQALSLDNETPLLIFPLAVIFPALLVIALLLMKGAGSRESLLMRFGTILQLILIIIFKDWALYLALGFPFVFLVVEIFETRLPKSISTPLSRLVIA